MHLKTAGLCLVRRLMEGGWLTGILNPRGDGSRTQICLRSAGPWAVQGPLLSHGCLSKMRESGSLSPGRFSIPSSFCFSVSPLLCVNAAPLLFPSRSPWLRGGGVAQLLPIWRHPPDTSLTIHMHSPVTSLGTHQLCLYKESKVHCWLMLSDKN